MELHATGLNAWDQLNFDQSENSEPDDLSHFTRILSDDNIQAVYPHLSYTLGKWINKSPNPSTKLTSSQVHVASGPIAAGLVPPDHTPLTLLNDPSALSHLAQSANGITVGEPSPSQPNRRPNTNWNRHGSSNPLPLCPVNDAHAPLVQPNPNPAWLQLSQLLPHSIEITQLIAYDAGFAALTTSGEVYTWGDERYAACLARDDSTHAQSPGLVSKLADLPTGPISKIAAGGYVLAALTAENDLYVWGHAGRAVAAGLSGGGIEITEDPTPVVIEDHDIADVAVGEAHLVVLTTTGEVFVIGSNINGQLGLPGSKSVEKWTRVEPLCPDSSRKHVVAVAAGPRNTFLLVDNKCPNT